MKDHLLGLQKKFKAYVKGNGSDVTLLNEVIDISKKLPHDGHVMIMYPDGKIFAHNHPKVFIGKTMDNGRTNKALSYRNTKEPLIQRWTSDDGCEVIDMSLPVIDDSNPLKFHGIVRIALCVDN